MKIVHISLYGPVTDGWNYQDNMLPKFQVKDGHDVTIIASKWDFNSNGKIEYFNKTNYSYNGIKVVRLDLKLGKDIYSKFKIYKNLYDELIKLKPDCLFIHGVQFIDIHTIVKYVRKYPTTVYVDNHCDFSNSGKNWISKNILHSIIWKHFAMEIEPYVKKFYGVLPARVDFLEKVYGLPKEKCELLLMGVDDDYVDKYANPQNKKEVYDELGISSSSFLIVTGGKIDSFKKQTLLLMEAVNRLKEDNVVLLVFGSVEDNLKKQFNSLLADGKVIYIGWIDSLLSYKYFSASDLVVFPGRHSVFWEEVAGLGIPMMCKYWEGTTHIDVGGNVVFLMQDSVDEIQSAIENLVNNREAYQNMLTVAQGKGKEQFSYKKIAERAIL